MLDEIYRIFKAGDLATRLFREIRIIDIPKTVKNKNQIQ